FSGPSFGAAELRAAVEGTWRLTVRGEDGTEQTVTFRLAQGSEAEGGHASARALVRPAAAGGTRSRVRRAGACMDVTRMRVEVTRIAEGGEPQRVEPGEFMVFGNEFHLGELRISIAEVHVSARVTPGGEARDVSSYGVARRELRSAL